MNQKNGRLIQIIIQGMITVMLALALYWMNDFKSDLRELRNYTTNHVTEIREDIGEIKGMLEKKR